MPLRKFPLQTRGPDLPADGRRLRSRSSRDRIVAAMLELVGAGEVSPSAAQVAEVAGVGLRSVFRHFQDVDALYREMGEIIAASVLPIILAPPAGNGWKDRLRDIATRRAQVFEAIMPYRISASLKRFQSDFLMQDYRRLVHLEGQTLEAHLPEAVKADTERRRGLIVILSFQTWRLLRHDQHLPVEEAVAVVARLLEDAMAHLPDA